MENLRLSMWNPPQTLNPKTLNCGYHFILHEPNISPYISKGSAKNPETPGAWQVLALAEVLCADKAASGLCTCAIQGYVHSRKLTWKPKKCPLKTTVLLKGNYMGFHVSLGECISLGLSLDLRPLNLWDSLLFL